MRASLDDICGCFPTGRHYPGIADRMQQAFTAVAGLSKHLAATARWAEDKLAVIDFETTGLDPQNDRVIEVGVACFEAGQLRALKNWLVNPGMAVPEAATAVHGITNEQLADAPRFEQIVTELRALLEDRLPVAYNAQFDRGFLHAELERAGEARSGEEAPAAYQSDVVWVDPLVWARELHKGERSFKLVEVAARLGVPLDNAHRAASDAEATGRVLLALGSRMPSSYGELIRLQSQYAARQDVDRSMTFRRRG